MARVLGCIAAMGLAGCGGGDLPGAYFDVTVTGTENLCTGGGADYEESFEYRIVLKGNDLTVAIGEDIFATGIADGCSLSYTSLVWSDIRDGHEIQWQILADARVDLGGGAGCVESGDWAGTETFIITTSQHPDVSPGCTYALDVTGKFLQVIEE